MGPFFLLQFSKLFRSANIAFILRLAPEINSTVVLSFILFSIPPVSSSYILKVNEGSTVNLPCDRPPSSKDLVHWYRYDKGMTNGTRKQLNPAETGEMVDGDRLEWLFGPFEKDMTITLNDVKMEDAGMYYCETAEEGRDSSNFNTIELIVEGNVANLLLHAKTFACIYTHTFVKLV